MKTLDTLNTFLSNKSKKIDELVKTHNDDLVKINAKQAGLFNKEQERYTKVLEQESKNNLETTNKIDADQMEAVQNINKTFSSAIEGLEKEQLALEQDYVAELESTIKVKKK